MKRMKYAVALAAFTLVLVAGLSGWAEEQPAKEKPAAKAATEPITKGQRVLVYGASMHGWLWKWLAEVNESAGIKDHQESAFSDDTKKSRALLNDGKVDVLTAMWYEHPPAKHIAEFATSGSAKNPNFRLMIQETWVPGDGKAWPQTRDPKEYAKLTVEDFDKATSESLRKLHEPYIKEWDDAVRAVNAKLSKPVVFVAPVGQAVILLRERIIAGKAPGIAKQSELFRGPQGHPKAAVCVLTTYCFFAMIHQRSPVGLPVPKELAKEKEAEQLNRLLQELAWEAVVNHPLSGVKAEAKAAPK